MTANALAQIAASIQAGQPLQAEQLCRSWLSTQPKDENLLLMLAISLHMQQRRPEAREIYAELTRLCPRSSVHWGNYGTILMELGALDEAEAAYARACQLDPGNASPKIHQGLLLIRRHDYLAAREVLLDAYRLDREFPLARIHAARACCLCQDFEGAEELLAPWPKWLPLADASLQLELAQALSLVGDVPATVALLEDLLARQPGYLDAGLQLAVAYERSNRLADAESIVAPIARATSGVTEPQRGKARHVLATLALRRNDPAEARRLLEQCGPNDDEDYAHYFELAAACDKLGEAEAAMQALREAHRRHAAELRLAFPAYFAPDAPALPTDAPRVAAEQYRRWPRLAAPEALDSPVFVVGFPRSGTTLLEQMLDAHPRLQSMDENPFFNRLAGILRRHDPRILDDLSVLRQYDCDELRKRYHAMAGERVVRRQDTQLVDKNPLNMQWLPLIHRLFPEARFILALRHPCDVILSCYMQNFRSSMLSAACASLERLAHAYVEAMTQWLEDVDVFKPTVLVSRYESLVDDVSGQAARIARFLQLDEVAPMLAFDRHARGKAFIATPSYSQVIEPVNRKGLGRWQRYRHEFEPLLPILEPMLRHWGYTADMPG
ncbi:tetratricopeptide repeat-containing sulfotransferase family protein [Dyella sedimenti]|uniref:tetratricopeptide repeat-containing sulfotransferase family protein n=1 Tax=Dyella sedimenti TaxID=2919947 RepID=UPI001FAAE5C7|nr:tetratricopeptide repeat-containing sulfotransferase family protein [Dyella sedimenti]